MCAISVGENAVMGCAAFISQLRICSLVPCFSLSPSYWTSDNENFQEFRFSWWVNRSLISQMAHVSRFSSFNLGDHQVQSKSQGPKNTPTHHRHQHPSMK